MDEMNNVMVENETLTETTPVEVVPESAVDVTYDEDHESGSGINLKTVVGGVVVGATLVGLGVKYGVPVLKKGFNSLREKFTHKKAEETEHEVSEEETSDEE